MAVLRSSYFFISILFFVLYVYFVPHNKKNFPFHIYVVYFMAMLINIKHQPEQSVSPDQNSNQAPQKYKLKTITN